MPFNIDDDEYVAKLLAQDAKKTSKTYDLVGLDAFNPKRPRAGAPKPNTNFLRHIIRQTDSHNAALLAKEAEESSSRLRQINRKRDKERTEAVDRAKRRIEGRLSPPSQDEDLQKRRSRRREDDDDSRRGDLKRRRQDDRSGSRSRRHRDRSRERHRHKRRHEHSDEDRASQKSRRSRDDGNSSRRNHHDRKEKDSDKPHHRSRRRTSYSRSPPRSRSKSPRHETHKQRDRSRSPRRPPHSPKTSRKNRRHSNTSVSDSDPLEAIVGPLPPPPNPSVRSRGRGALKANSIGIESRFSANYDPSVDVKPESDADDWGEALEAMRDRERWKQQGADRLRAAGFKDEQVKKWEKGGDPLEEDVVWTKRGQDRQWDRGKVVDEDGDVELKAEWGRLK